MKRTFDPRQRLEALAASLPSEMGSLLDELRKPGPRLGELPGGDAIESLIKQIAEPMGHQLQLLAQTRGVRHFQSRIFVFERDPEAGSDTWMANPALFADSLAMSKDPQDLLDMLEASQKGYAGEDESIAVWVHAIPIPDTPLFMVLTRHSSGTLAQFLLREGAWAQTPLGERTTRLLLQAELAKGPGATEFWTECIGELLLGLVRHRTSELDQLLQEYGVSTRLDDAQLSVLVQRLLVHDAGLRVCQTMARFVAHRPLQEAQALLETLTGLVEQAAQAIEDKVAKTRKEQAGALKRAQATLERQRMLYEGMKRRADRLAQENTQLRQAGVAATSRIEPLAKAEVWRSAARLLEGL